MNAKSDPVVQTKYGKLEGILENDLYCFKGVPYAAPPAGKLRWLPPQPPESWQGTRPAKTFGAIAPQLEIILPPGMQVPPEGPEPQSEDCLFLNIWTPGLDNAKRPVMVWIHGGAFTQGSGSSMMYRDGKLASHGNIVLVTINYRMGMLGFLNLNEITHGKIPATGNEGLMDQVAALEWVRGNIAAFGGDPDNVTVFGESAGGMSIGCLLAMPGARGLFQKAILESGVGSVAQSLAESVKVAAETLELLELEAGDTEKLRAVPVSRLLSVQQEMTLNSADKLTPVMPVIDGKVLPDPMEALRNGTAPGVPVIIGSNRDEWKLFEFTNFQGERLDTIALAERLEHLMPVKNLPLLIETYRAARRKRGESVTMPDIASAILTDAMFRIPSIQALESRCKHQEAAFSYLFTWPSPFSSGALGACHALEVGFVFNNREELFCGAGPQADRLTEQMQDAWTTFARTGNPSCESLGDWPQYCEGRKTMILSESSHVEESPLNDERQIWSIVGANAVIV